MKILFVCKHNRFRSKVAEAIFKKLDSEDDVKSAGMQIDFMRPYVCENVKKSLEKRGYIIENEQSREINNQDLEWADKIVIVANDVPLEIFPREKLEIWEVEDADENEKEKIDNIVGEIEKRVKKLVSKL